MFGMNVSTDKTFDAKSEAMSQTVINDLRPRARTRQGSMSQQTKVVPQNQ